MGMCSYNNIDSRAYSEPIHFNRSANRYSLNLGKMLVRYVKRGAKAVNNGLLVFGAACLRL